MKNELQKSSDTRIAVFKGTEIRKTIHENEWWFVIEDIVSVLTDTVQVKGYIKDMRRRDPELAKGWGQIATPLIIQTPGGHNRNYP
jgi:prophage antirepressor-like protein